MAVLVWESMGLDSRKTSAAAGIVALEQRSSFWSRTAYAWLAVTFWRGHKRVISVDDLPPLDGRLESSRIQIEIEITAEAWSAPGHSSTLDWQSVYQYQSFRFVTRLRGSLIALVYQQMLQTRAANVGSITGLTLMGTDVERIVAGVPSLHEAWASLLEIGLACWLLERQLSLACIAPILLVSVFIAATSRVSLRLRDTQVAWIEKIQERLRITAAVLGDMKTVKMLGISSVVVPVIQGLRRDEIDTSRRFRKNLVVMILLSPVLTFAVYSVVAVFWKNETLLTTKAFTSLTLVSLLTAPVISFIQGLPNVVQCLGNFSRIQEFCNYETGGDAPGSASSSSKETSQRRPLMAYCAQQPWLENGTIRRSIVGASPWDSRWHGTVCTACCLDPDMPQLEMGDLTHVGSKGVNLSDGQKQRIALARAVYSRRRTLLLDDVFSGMDAYTAGFVIARLLGCHGGLLRNEQTTVILTTHSRLVDEVIVLEDGQVTEMGSPTALLQNKGGYLRKIGFSKLAEENDMKLTAASHPGPASGSVPREEIPGMGTVGDTDATVNLDDGQETATAEHTDVRRKNCELSIYTYYLRSSGYVAVALYAASMIFWIFCTEFSTVWVSWWSAANDLHPNRNLGLYMGIYAMVGVVGTAAACCAAWFAYISIISNSASKLHLDLLKATFRAPFRFFANTDTGELLNRCIYDLRPSALSCFTQVVLLAIYSRSLAVAMPFVAAFLYALQRFYLQTSRQMRLLMIEAKAPLYTQFSEMGTPGTTASERSGSTAGTGTGTITIRAFGWQRAYAARVAALVDRSQRPAYIQSCIQHWLDFVLTLTMAVLVVVLVATVVSWQDRLDISAGGVGVSLVVLLGLSTTLTRLIRTWTRLEPSVGAVARVRRFVTETEETAGEEVPVSELSQPVGTVCFDDLVAAYEPDAASPVLQHVSLSVPPGQHLAICGRSGSGKTSLVMALLHMMDVRSGGIAVHGRVSVVSQDPFLVPGTSLRFNMDPLLAAVSDAQIVRVLQRVGLWEVVEGQGSRGRGSSSGCLDQKVDGLALSAGQRQLLCFSRALVYRDQTDVLVLDEATCSLDSSAEAVVQQIIDTDFRGCTVLAVMHRLAHVASYDRVAVMDAGALVEDGAPGELIANESSRFAELYLT
ncbi:ABC multidrug transporter [Grosmannia clavigera kw1407]|uniref:ABC multidrug transporter n=1 Tax=Grosmannia clavigera (strain kw1407 / UAMH 11150) TaxID=655863 RepID=F0X6U5_GROCL|nr:ABC multidrug transporter [Grosmannia clavigera kw1407]EFX06313.1 ABC multidrug transporter [Grosmannia clavigera kw1407]